MCLFLQDGLRRRMDKLKSSIEEANLAVDKEREKNVSLLHTIFPPNIAKRLWLGKYCSLLFSYFYLFIVSELTVFSDPETLSKEGKKHNVKLKPLQTHSAVPTILLLSYVSYYDINQFIYIYIYTCDRLLSNSYGSGIFFRNRYAI